jgi:hypothetical protein
MRRDLISIGWKPLRKIKAAMVAAGTVQVLHVAFSIFGADVDEDIVKSIGDSVAQMWAIWIPIVTAYYTKSRRDEV